MAKILFPLNREDANIRPLVDRVAMLDSFWADPQACIQFVQDGFERLGLPVPGAKEFIETVDCGHLMFVTPAGCTIRLEAADPDRGAHVPGHTDFNSEFVLQPIGRIDGPGLSLCIYPGLDIPWAETDAQVDVDMAKLDRALRHDHIDVPGFDMRGDNIGYLPFSSPQWPRGVPVLIDPGAALVLSERVGMVKHILHSMKHALSVAGPSSPVQQQDMFRDLRGRFVAALARGGGVEMNDFWAACADAKQAGRLKADWVNLPENFKDIPSVARNYEKRLQDVPGMIFKP